MRKRSVGPFYVSIVRADKNPAWLSSQNVVCEFRTLKDARVHAKKIACSVCTIGNYKGDSDIGFVNVLMGKNKCDNPVTVRTQFAKAEFLAQKWRSLLDYA